MNKLPFLEKIKSFIASGHSRSKLVKKNTAYLFILKGCDVVISFLFVPLTLGYVDKKTYGIWLTLTSVITWFNLLDIGINNGLRNKFAEARAIGDDNLAQKYISTSYALLSLVSITILLIYLFLKQYLDWNSILRISYPNDELQHAVSVVVSYFCVRFILSSINIITIADQRPAFSSFIGFISHCVSLVVIFILVKTTEGSLLKLCYALCITPVIILLFYNILLFSTQYRNVRPKFSAIDFSLAKNLLNLGVVFFVIQIAMIIQFQTSNLIIIRSFGESDVTSYNIAYKYFSSINMLLAIILTPLWSSATDAYIRKDISWIKNAVKKYSKILYLLFALGVLLLILSPIVYELWLGKQSIQIPFQLSFWMLIYVFSLMFGRLHGTILNGIGALRIQMYSAVISPFVFLGMCYLFIHVLNWSVISILIAGIIANFNSFIVAPLQYRKIFIENRKGFWIK